MKHIDIDVIHLLTRFRKKNGPVYRGGKWHDAFLCRHVPYAAAVDFLLCVYAYTIYPSLYFCMICVVLIFFSIFSKLVFNNYVF